MIICTCRVTKSLTLRSEELLEREKDRPEWLIPVTVDFDVQLYNEPGIKVKDRFLWNLNGWLGVEHS